MTKAKAKPTADLSYEQAFQELETLVARLESGDPPLEEALSLFERGQALAARCGRLLEQAELKLKALTPEGVEALEDTDLESEETA
jgi:exodeoxyribonuclease VII small subunit